MSDTPQLTYLKKQITKHIAKRKSGANFHRNKHYITAMIDDYSNFISNNN
ncbi:MAG: hypothetical protein PVI26_01265 [Chitinispirillia bacterium]